MKIQFFKNVIVPSILAALVMSLVSGSYSQEALGQTTQRQTPAETANMTAADFNVVSNNLIAARQAILNNDSVSAFNTINTAGSDLFQLSQNAAGGDEKLFKQIVKQLRPVQNNIDNTRDALLEQNGTQAIRSLNNADLRLLTVIQVLPQGEVAEEE